MAYAAYNYTISDASGNIVTGASVEVRRESDNVLVSIYSDRDGTTPLANPFTDATGTGRFHAAGSAYKVTATKDAFTRSFRFVPIGLGGEVDSIFESITANTGEGVSIDSTDPRNPVISGVAFTGDSGSGGVKGMVPAPASGDAAANKFLKADGTFAVPPVSSEPVFTGDSGSGGVKGLVPAPAAGDAAAGKFLKADGTFAVPPTPPSGGMTLLGTITTTSGTTQALTSISSGYKSLRLLFRGVSASGTFGLTLALSSTNGGAYGAAVAITTGTSINIARGVYGVIDIFGYTEAVTGKAISGALVTDNSVISLGAISPGALTNTAAACDALRIGTDAGNLDAGSVEVYGVK